MDRDDRRRVHRGASSASLVLCLLALSATLMTGCGTRASAADCNANIATVNGTAVPRWRYNEYLKYTLAFYEQANPRSKYYHHWLCKLTDYKSQCAAVKSSLVDRMIAQQIIDTYAASHSLRPTARDWTVAMRKESSVVQNAGGEQAFIAYLTRVGLAGRRDTGIPAQFRWLESEQLEAANVAKYIGQDIFKTWLTKQVASAKVVRCEP
jgi:hypothetical protein